MAIGYGEIGVEDNATETTFSAAGSWSQVAVFDENRGNAKTTADHTSDHITIDQKGIYVISATASVSGPANTRLAFAVFSSGVRVTARQTVECSGVSDVQRVFITGIANLSRSRTIQLRVQNEDSASSVVVEDAALSVSMIRELAMGSNLFGPLLIPVNTEAAASFSDPSSLDNLALWLRADTGLTKAGGGTPGDGDAVERWQSKEGNAYNFDQTPTAQPVFKTGQAYLNGAPSLLFDGSDDHLLYSGSISSAATGTIFIVIRFLTASGDSFLSFSESGANQDTIHIRNPAGQEVRLTIGDEGGLTNIDGDTAIVDNTDNLIMVQQTGSGIEIKLNGADQTETGATTNWFANYEEIDNAVVAALSRSSVSQQFPGHVAEVIVYDDVLSASEISDVENYISTRYGISLP